jgi:hypothetical protein
MGLVRVRTVWFEAIANKYTSDSREKRACAVGEYEKSTLLVYEKMKAVLYN